MPLVMMTTRRASAGLSTSISRVGRGGVGASPALDDCRRRAGEDVGVFVEDQVIDGTGRERVGCRGIVVGVTHNERTVLAPYHDQVHAVADVLALLGFEPRAQRRCGRTFGVAEIADQAEIGHHGRQGRIVAFRAHPQHVQLAAREPVRGDQFGVQRAEVVSRADHDGLGRDGTAARLKSSRSGGMHDRVAQKDDTEAFREIGREPRDGIPRLDPDFVRAMQGSREALRPKALTEAVDVSGFDEPAPDAHVGLEEVLQHRSRFGASCDREEATLQHGDAGRNAHLEPHVARPHGALPAGARLLARHGGEAEIAYRGAVRLGIAVDDDHPFSQSGRGERVGKATDARTHHREVVVARGRERVGHVAIRTEGARLVCGSDSLMNLVGI